ncbi:MULTISPECIES: hypothetical protein [Acidiphilium]|nr:MULTISPECIES: hypothetical protein [Acidiphilium]
MKIFVLVAGLVVLFAQVSWAESHSSAPKWLIGKWVVTKVLEVSPSGGYVDPPVEPKVAYAGRVMTICADALSLTDETCKMPVFDSETGRLSNAIDMIMPFNTLHALGMHDKIIHYWSIKCGAFIHGGDDIGSDYRWVIIPKNADRIDLPFLAGGYLELSRVGGTS